MSKQRYTAVAECESGWESVEAFDIISPSGSRYKHVAKQQVMLRSGQIEIEVDLERIVRQLGARALLNRSGMSRSMSGAVTVKVAKRHADKVIQTKERPVPETYRRAAGA